MASGRTDTSVEFQDTSASLGHTLRAVASSLGHGETVTLREVLALLGEQGLLVFCVLLTLPFVLPVSIPGVSTAFGAVIILLGIGIVANRVPWLPAALMLRPLRVASLVPMLERGADFVARFDRFIHPRLRYLTATAALNRTHGLALTFSGLLLIVPFGFIPLSNKLPAFAILFLALGMLQRDGCIIIAGYSTVAVSVVYFGVLLALALAGGQALGHLIGG